MAAAQFPNLSFIPKQATPKSAALFESIIGNTSEVVAQHILTSRLPPIATNSVIHDNGCGTLQVAGELFTPTGTNSNPASNLKVHATDSNPQQIDGARAKALANKWPIDCAVMKAQELTFPSNTFDISFSNFVIMGLETPELAAKQLYRTIKPGGKVVICTWAYMPHDLPLKKAHTATRGQEAAPLRIQWGGDLLAEKFVRDFYLSGGFEEEKIDIRQFSMPHRLPDVKVWAEGLWSFLGDTKEGWNQEDEMKWGEAVQTIVGEVKKSDGYVVDGKGAVLQFVAHIGVATK